MTGLICEQTSYTHSGFNFFFWVKTGEISSLYDRADHYWDFEQSTVSEIADDRTSTKITVHGTPIVIPSPTGNSIYLQGPSDESTIDLMQVTDSSCLFDPSVCPTGLSISMFVKGRPRRNQSISNPQMYFGNSEGTELRQGVTIYYNETNGGNLNVTVFGSTNYCFRYVALVKNSWTYLHLTWNSTGKLSLYIEHNTQPSVQGACGSIPTPLPTERTYSLGRAAFPEVYIDNLAIWFQVKQPFIEPWSYITGRRNCQLLSPGGYILMTK